MSRDAAEFLAQLGVAPAADADPGKRGAVDPMTDPATPEAGGTPETGDEDAKKALAYVLRSTGQRPQTEAEIRTKLRRRYEDPAVVEGALRQAKRMGAIDDVAFARAWVEDRGRKRGFGQARLRQELLRRDVPDHVVDEALAELDDRDDLAAATELARQRLARMPGGLDAAVIARRLVGFLVRRGYTGALAQRVAREVSGLDRSWD